jgi:hypothetical protein
MKEESAEDEFLRIGQQQRVQKHDQVPDPRPGSGNLKKIEGNIILSLKDSLAIR